MPNLSRTLEAQIVRLIELIKKVKPGKARECLIAALHALATGFPGREKRMK